MKTHLCERCTTSSRSQPHSCQHNSSLRSAATPSRACPESLGVHDTVHTIGLAARRSHDHDIATRTAVGCICEWVRTSAPASTLRSSQPSCSSLPDPRRSTRHAQLLELLLDVVEGYCLAKARTRNCEALLWMQLVHSQRLYGMTPSSRTSQM